MVSSWVVAVICGIGRHGIHIILLRAVMLCNRLRSAVLLRVVGWRYVDPGIARMRLVVHGRWGIVE